MTGWSLPGLLSSLHDDIEHRSKTARESFCHPGTEGDASEAVWVDLLQTCLPRRYQVETAHVVDSEGVFGQQIDVVIFDRQYSPFIFHLGGRIIVPAESVHAVFEARQTINARQAAYPKEKAAGEHPPEPPSPILAGLLTFQSDGSPGLGQPLANAPSVQGTADSLDLGCVAAHGIFGRDREEHHAVTQRGKPATAFLLELIARLQLSAPCR